MDTPNMLLDLQTIEQLSAEGRYPNLVAYVEGRESLVEARGGSPTLALLYGTAQARLGQLAEGDRWVTVALQRARERGDRAIEVRALNVRGAIALESGRLDDASE